MILEGQEDSMINREIKSLFEIERQSRQNNQLELNLKTGLEIVDLLEKAEDLELYRTTLKTLCSKRGQPMKTTTEVVKRGMQFMNTIQEEQEKIKFVQTMKEITEKKIFLEVEYARCCMILVKFNESQTNDLKEAVKIMEKVQVETYGSMTKQEKFDFILYQVKLNLLLEDYTRVIIVLRKINPKHLEEKGLEYLKFQFYLYKFTYHRQEQQYKECKESLNSAFEALQEFDDVNELKKQVDKIIIEKFSQFLDKKKLAEAILSFLSIQNFEVEKSKEVEQTLQKYDVYTLENRDLKNLLNSFITQEISSCEMRDYPKESFLIFCSSYDSGVLYEELERQLIKKNLYLVSLYYRSITMRKLTKLLKNRHDVIEDLLCDMIGEDFISGKIDRLTETLVIRQKKTDNEVVDQWVQNINEIVDLVDFVTERIEREN